MAESRGIRRVGYFDCAGGGQIVVENGYAYIGHMRSPHGTTIVDVKDPKSPQAVDLTAFLYQRDRDYCIDTISSRW